MPNHFFCPNPNCSYHNQKLKSDDWYITKGYYQTKAFGLVARFQCKHCDTGFSEQTFSVDYYSKKQIDYQSIYNMANSCVNYRAIGRNLGVSHQSVANRIDRMARQFMSFDTEKLAELSLQENLAADGFESFCVSQYFPNNINLVAGEKSQFVYFINYVLLKRKGRMTKKQKERKEEIESIVEYPEKGMVKAFTGVLDTVEELMKNRQSEEVILHTDKNSAYKQALNKHDALKEMQKAGDFIHNTVSSRAARNKNNPLFPVNYMDREIRKDQSNHVRETACFSRNVCNMLNKMVMYIHYHNFCKPFRIDKKGQSLFHHAEKAGLCRVEYDEEIRQLFSRRRFLSFSNHVKGFWELLWKRMILTPLKRRAEYLPAYALA